jgi:hypothetical protein
VLHYDHWRRARFFGRKALNVPMAPIITEGEEGLRRAAQEKIMLGVWRAALLGTTPGDIEALQRRESRIDALVGRMRPLLRTVIQ